MNRRLRRLSYRAANIIRDHGQESLELLEFASAHPITMKLILQRLKNDNEIAVEEIKAAQVEPLLGPGDED